MDAMNKPLALPGGRVQEKTSLRWFDPPAEPGAESRGSVVDFLSALKIFLAAAGAQRAERAEKCA